MSVPFKYYFSEERFFWGKRGALIRGRRSLNISREKRGTNLREALFRAEALFRVNTVCCVNKKLFHIEVTLITKVIWVTKKYVVVWQRKLLCDTQKRDSRWLNMFSVTQKRNTCRQKIIPVVYRYMLHWLKKFCVARKISWYHTKTKIGEHKFH